eukprot:GEMP01024248.1.p1 GENE.GEMP01024248.1~~GEMP01024248.1.p1  ORF type:complete len:242 (+),score=47.47 GEMP01024248.1:52-777(+)
MHYYDRDRRLTNGEYMVLYHATTQDAAHQIVADGRFKCGKKGMAGGAIYFGVSPEAVGYKNKFTRHGVSTAELAIFTCKVKLGRVKDVEPFCHYYTFEKLLGEGFDSVEIVGKEVYAVFNSDQIEIIDVYNLLHVPKVEPTPQRAHHMEQRPILRTRPPMDTERYHQNEAGATNTDVPGSSLQRPVLRTRSPMDPNRNLQNEACGFEFDTEGSGHLLLGALAVGFIGVCLLAKLLKNNDNA